MDYFVVGVVLFTSAIQSLFGVGVLLFGTPLLLIYGYEFTETLSILLPLSLSINALQIFREWQHINVPFFKRLSLYSIPCIVLSLVLVTEAEFDFSIIVGLFLVLISMRFVSQNLWNTMLYFLKFEKVYFAVTGTIHGLTNLGGALLTTKVFSHNWNVQQKRSTISASYFTFALFQMATLISVNEFKGFSVWYLVAGITVFFICERFVYSKIATSKYDVGFALFLFCSGVTLINKGWL